MKWAVLALAGVALLTSTPTHAAGPDGAVVGAWRMNETRGDRLHDASGLSNTGRIGKAVIKAGQWHRFGRLPMKTPERPNHIDLVQDSNLLDFGTDTFSITARIHYGRVGTKDRNIVQKGQGSPTGGLFKMKTNVGNEPLGMVKCLFRGDQGDSTVNSATIRRLDNRQWHVVTCKRSPVGTVMIVDGRVVDRNDNDPGAISNDWPLAIGGNSYCDGATNLCNYFWGLIGFVKVWRAP